MHELFYRSMASREMSDEDILNILRVSRKNNSKLGVTGILVYKENIWEFVQVLEGEKQTIFKLFKTITTDKRHKSIHLLHENEIQERSFKDWSMAFACLDSIDKTKIDGVSDFLEKGFTYELTQQNPSFTVQLLQAIKDLSQSKKLKISPKIQ